MTLAAFSDPGVAQDLAYALQLVLGAVFAAAAIPKLRRPKHFTGVVAGYELLPRGAAGVVAPLVIAVELLLAVAFLTGWALAPALVAAVLLVGVFLWATRLNLRRGREIECGCFGATGERISPRSLTRQGLLLGGMLVLAALVATPGVDAVTPGWLGARGSGAGTYVVSVAGIGVALLALAAWGLELRTLREVTARPQPKPEPPVQPLLQVVQVEERT